MKTKLSSKFWVALTVYSLLGQVVWVVENMYLNVFIYNMFNASAGDISLMVSASAVSATLTTLFMGALSDRIGKRKVFICGGYIAWGISIFAFCLVREDIIKGIWGATASWASIGVTAVIILDCLMTFFGSTANDAAFNAWVTDSTDSTNRGAAEGINSMMPMIAILAVFGGFMAFDLEKSQSWTVIFAIIGVLVLIAGIMGCFIIKKDEMLPSESGYLKNLVYGFRPSTMKKNSSLYLCLVGFIVFNISIQIFMPYLIIYYEKTLKMTNYTFILAPAVILASVATFFWGRVYDKKGFTPSFSVSSVVLVSGYVVLSLFKDTALVFVGSLLMMCGYLCTMAVFGAKIRDLTPTGKAGMFQGVRIFSQVLIPGVIGPYIGKTVLEGAEQIENSDGTTSFLPNEDIFVAALVAVLVAMAFTWLVSCLKREKK